MREPPPARDRRSGVRAGLVVGVGVGHVAAELDAFGVALAERGARTDENVEALLALWRADAAAFHGRWTQFSAVVERPPPLQQPHPPIMNAAFSARGHEFATRCADLSFVSAFDLESVAAKVSGSVA